MAKARSMFNFKTILPHLLIASILQSCSSLSVVPQKVTEVNPSKELGLNPQISLSEQVSRAKMLGEKASTFLATDLFLKANDASAHGDAQTSIVLYRYVNSLFPTDQFVAKKLAYELVRTGDLKEAERVMYGVYKETKGQDESVGLMLAGIYSALDKKSYAEDIYKKLIALHRSMEACLYFAKNLSQEKKYYEAHVLLKDCQKKNPDEAAFSFYRGKIDYERGKVSDAIAFFEAALKIDPTYSQAILAIGAIEEDRDNLKSAKKRYIQFLEADEENAFNSSVLSKLVAIMLTMEEAQAVLPYLETLVSVSPDDLNSRVRLGLIYSENMRYEDALKIFKEVSEVAPESDKIAYYLAAINHQMQKYDDAISAYLKITKDSPLYGDASMQLGQIYSIRAREDEAIGQNKGAKALVAFVNERAKENKELALELKVIESAFYDDGGKTDLALKTLEPHITSANSDGHIYYYASLLEKVGNYKDARGMIKKILDKDPNNAHALNFLGYSWLERNENLDEAYKYISKAVDLRPNDGYIRDSLAWYYFTVGKYKEALKESKKAFELVNSDVTITKHLAQIYEKLSSFDLARKTYAEALKNVKAEKDREELLKRINELEVVRLPAQESK